MGFNDKFALQTIPVRFGTRSIEGFAGNHSPNTTSWVLYIALTTRDEVNVTVSDSLTCYIAIVHADIEAVHRRILLRYLGASLVLSSLNMRVCILAPPTLRRFVRTQRGRGHRGGAIGDLAGGRPLSIHKSKREGLPLCGRIIGRINVTVGPNAHYHAAGAQFGS